MENTTHTDEGGYILLYVLLAMTLFAILASSVLKSTVEDVELGAQELAAVKAQAAADAAAECISYWARQPDFPFNTNTDVKTFNCNTGAASADFASISRNQDWCTADTEPYTLPNLANGGCAEVTVDVLPRLVTDLFTGPSGPEASRTRLCSVRVRATGYDDCATKAVSRVRWETIGGWATNPANPNTNAATLIGDPPALSDPTVSPEGYSMEAVVAPHAVLQVEVSGVAGTLHESNAIEVMGDRIGAWIPPGVGAVNEVVWYQVVDDAALGAFAGSVRYEFRDDYDPTDTDPLFTAFEEPTLMTVEVPGNMPPSFYRIAVRVRYGALVYDDVMVYLDVTRAGRGQE